jgi:hypothetical protein
MLATNRSFSLVILLALLVSLILSAFVPPLLVAATQPKAPSSWVCSDPDTVLVIELNSSHCIYGDRMP